MVTVIISVHMDRTAFEGERSRERGKEEVPPWRWMTEQEKRRAGARRCRG